MALKPDITIGSVTVSPRRRTAFVNGQEIDLTAREFSLLHYLMERAGRIVSREELAHEVWGDERALQSNTIDVNICHLRTKIGDSRRKIISSIRGVGYFYAQR
ncbi:MAG: winged helix-turn-helix domain-containing protein [Coriobacteriia bacterium]|nr:winged helix-turn-helix domain-containing protein [Coriobacteriia bacterium]